MKPIATLFLGLALAGTALAASARRAESLRPVYRAGAGARVELTSTSSFELVSRSVEQDGEIRETPGGASSTTETWSAAWNDRAEAVAEGAPTTVVRHFEDIAGERASEGMRGARSTALESEFDGAKVRLVRDGESVEAEVLEGGDVPLERLASLGLTPPFDGLLPEGEVKVDGVWTVSGPAFEDALGLGVAKALFATPAAAEAPEGGGRRGGRGGRGMGGGDRAGAQMLHGTEWDLEARLVAIEDGIARITIGGDGERIPTTENTVGELRATVEGELLFDVARRMTTGFEAQVEYTLDSTSEFAREELTVKMSSSYAGTLKVEASIDAVAAE